IARSEATKESAGARAQLEGDCFASLAMTAECLFLPANLPGPGGERSHHIADETARRLVGEITVGVEFGLRLTDQHLGLVDRVHVEEHHAAAEIALPAGAAGHACRSAHDCAWLPSERL